MSLCDHRSTPTVVTAPLTKSASSGEGPRTVQVGTSPRNSSTCGRLACGSLVSPSPARCSGVSKEQGSTPSNRTSRGRGGGGTALGAPRVPPPAAGQPPAHTQATTRDRGGPIRRHPPPKGRL